MELDEMVKIFQDEVYVLDSEGREVIKLEASIAELSVGTQGNEGDIRVFDGDGRRVFRFDANLAH